MAMQKKSLIGNLATASKSPVAASSVSSVKLGAKVELGKKTVMGKKVALGKKTVMGKSVKLGKKTVMGKKVALGKKTVMGKGTRF